MTPAADDTPQDDSQKDLVPITLRIPKEVHARLKQTSQSEFRSLNHQIIMALSYFLEIQEKFGALPHPDALRKALPDSPKGFPSWIALSRRPRERAR